MITKLFNPFKYIAGAKSLVIGLLILVTTACLGYLSNTHFPDLISVKSSIPDFTLWYYIIQSLSNWFVLSAILYLCAIIASTSSVRLVDIFGTQALARYPYLIASLIGFSGSVNEFGKHVQNSVLGIGEPVSITTGAIIVAILIICITLLMSIWLVALMFNAFKVSANIKGAKLVVLFIIAFIVSWAITSMISMYLVRIFT